MPHSYRKKPVVVEAAKFKGHNAQDVADWIMGNGGNCQIVPVNEQLPQLLIDTLEGPMRALTGDYVICGVKGEFYPCKPDIFDMSYERIE